MQKPPCRPKPQQTSSAERVLPAQPPEQRHTEARPNPTAPIPVHRVLPKTKLSTATLGRVGSRAPAQEDETMRANVKHRSTGKLLSRLSWPLHCQAQSPALPVLCLDTLTPSCQRGVCLITPNQSEMEPLATIPKAFVIASCLGQGWSLLSSPTYAYAAPSSQQGPVGNYRNTRDERVRA